MQVKLTEEDLNKLWGTELDLWARLCMHALKRAYRGESPAHVFSMDDLDSPLVEKDRLNLQSFGYISTKLVETDQFHRMITLLKYESNHPTTEQIQDRRRKTMLRTRKYRRGRI